MIRLGFKKRIEESREQKGLALACLKRAHIAQTAKDVTIRNIAKSRVITEMDLKLPVTADWRFLETSIAIAIDSLNRIIIASESILNHLSSTGFTGITYSLPAYILTHYGAEIGYSYLLLSGIKKNAKFKTLGSEMMQNELEIALLDYEMQLSKLIDDDLHVAPDNVAKFINLLMNYLYTYQYNSSETEKDDDFTFNCRLNTIMINMCIYLIYAHTHYRLNGEDIETFNKIYIDILDNTGYPGVALEKACKSLISIIEDRNAKVKPKEPSREYSAVKLPMQFEVYNYIEKGAVVTPCELQRFEHLLDETDLSPERKQEYLSQMTNLLNRQTQKAFDEKMDKMRKRVLSDRELKLYTMAWSNEETSKDAKFIDDVIEMMLTAETDEEIALLMEELMSPMRHLAEVLESKEVVAPRVMFLTETVAGEEHDYEVPKILNSVTKAPKGDLKQISAILNRLFGGVDFTHGDTELKGDRLPCKIWFKGKDYKVFYAVVKDVVVVLDVFRGQDAFRRALRMVSNEDFVERLNVIKAYIEQGNVPNESIYIDLVNRQLDTSKVYVKKAEEN